MITNIGADPGRAAPMLNTAIALLAALCALPAYTIPFIAASAERVL
jgi:hypothetical protein